jgi:hypothetical protein
MLAGSELKSKSAGVRSASSDARKPEAQASE